MRPAAVATSIRTWIVRNFAYRARHGYRTLPKHRHRLPRSGALATFYGALLDWKVDVSADWAEVRADYGQCISFQQVEAYTPPGWPNQEVPQQMHLDVIVDDLDAGEAAVLDLGATKHDHQPGTSFRVFLDPAGHPFCLCVD